MTCVVLLMALVGAGVFQAQAPGWPLFGLAKVPCLLGVSMYYAFARGRGLTLLSAVCAGVVQDALSRVPLGYSALLFCLVGLVLNANRNVVFSRVATTHMITGAAAGLFVTLALGGLLFVSRNPATGEGLVAADAGALLAKAAGSAILGMIFFPLIYRVMDYLDRLVGNVETSEADALEEYS